MLIPDLLSKLVHEFETNGGIPESFKAMGVEDLEEVASDFQTLYLFGDQDDMKGDLISDQDWLVFRFWEKVDQANFLAYLFAKIAVLREAESNDTVWVFPLLDHHLQHFCIPSSSCISDRHKTMKDLDLTLAPLESQYTPEEIDRFVQELAIPPIERQYDPLEAARIYQELSTFQDRDCDRAANFGF